MEEIKIAIRTLTVVLGFFLYSWIWGYLTDKVGSNRKEYIYIYWSWIFINIFAAFIIILWAFS